MVVGAVIASTFRNAKDLFVPLLLVVGAGVAFYGWWSQKNAQKVDVAIPLCTACDLRWSKAKAARPYFLTAFAASALGVIAGLATESKTIMIGGGALFFAVCIYAVVTKPAAAYVGATSVNGSRITLAPVAERAVSMIRNGEVPRRTRKKKTRKSESDSESNE